MRVLVINSGSSSLKYQVRDTDTNDVAASGVIGRIGEKGSSAANHGEAMNHVAAALTDELAQKPLDAVGHRVVHGGERFSEPVLINDEIVRSIELLNPLAPLHNPANVLGIRAITEKWPTVPQVAVFDTAFHRTLPEHAWRYAVPDELYRQYGIRRYGFHGTSHEFVAGRAAELLGVPVQEFNAVVAHIGNGVSLTAIQGGVSIDTSMGFTPLEGLVMGTRSGDLDPSIVVFLQRQGLSANQIDTMLNKESGLKALADNNDMRAIVDAAQSGDARARLALDISSYRLAKYIGGYHVAVGGALALVFTAGIGENSAHLRALVAQRLSALGVQLDDDANLSRSTEPRVISAPDSRIAVLVIPTDEERAIAEATAGVVRFS